MNKKNDGEPKRSIPHYQPLLETVYQGVGQEMDPGDALQYQDLDAAPLASTSPHPHFESGLTETIPTQYHYQYSDMIAQRIEGRRDFKETEEYEFPVLPNGFGNEICALSPDVSLFQDTEDFEDPNVSTSSASVKRNEEPRMASVDWRNMCTPLRKSQESTPAKATRTPTSVLKNEADARGISLDTLRKERKTERGRITAFRARSLARQRETTVLLSNSDPQSETAPAKSIPQAVSQNPLERKRITQKELKEMAEAQNISIDQVRRNRQNQQARAIRAKNSAKEERENSEQEATFRRNEARYNQLSAMNQIKMDNMTVDKNELERRRVELFKKLSSNYERELLVMLEKGNRLVAKLPSDIPSVIDMNMRKEHENLKEEYEKGKLEFEMKQLELRLEQQIAFAKLLKEMDEQ